ncbi:DUF4064 domain-containing protein [Sporolactobacillus kofuensis]|uniref:DUF4064 domain-containing protein n=1 Tax=Sporolactobacillus kofuensis TaxID=269672 RepID=A0ABW1WIK9_9BACL|nr:DUF4064 domain-containing protein [Sporolactobacillus kofuensis]MCO7176553.1 DUF4064 domain-containing protein [Sporolactobacillus kofuensis]
MKRTGELAMSVIGGCINLLFLLVGVRLLTVDYSAFHMQLKAAGAEQELTSQQVSEIVHAAQVFGNILLLFTIIILVLTVIGLFLLLKTKSTKTAGILLLIAGILSLPELLVPGILLIISGIMVLVRKPKQTDEF